MPLERLEANRIRIQHMLDAIREAFSFIQGKDRTHLDTDRMLVLSLLKELEILGEAASKVSLSFRNQQPEIPWEIIIGTRNRLIHGYFDIDLDIIWKTVSQDLTPLAELLEKILLY